MATTFYIADASDATLATKAVDLNGFDGTSGLQLLGDVSFGDIATDATWISQSPFPGAVQSSRRHEVATMAFKVRAVNVNYDTLVAMVRALSTALDVGGTMVYQPTASAQAVYIDFYSSPIHGLLRGQPLAMYQIIAGLQDPDGLPLEVWRFPYSRGSVLAAATNILANATLLIDTDNNGLPDGWTSSGTWTNRSVNWSARALEADIASAAISDMAMQTTPTGTVTPGQTYTLSFYARVVSGAGARMRANIDWLDSTGAFLSNSSGSTIVLSGSDQRITVSGTAPASASKVTVRLTAANSDANAYTIRLSKAQLEPAAAATPFRAGDETVTNDVRVTGGKKMMVYNPGSATALAKVSVIAESGAQLAATRIGRRSIGNLAEFVRSKFWMQPQDTGKSTQLDSDTTQVSDSAATGSLALQTTFASGTEFRRKWRQALTVTDPTAVDGVFRVFAVIRMATGAAANLQLRWATYDDGSTVTAALPVIPITYVASTVSGYIAVDMGTISMIQPGTLVLEGWAQTVTAGNLFWDVVTLIPAEEAHTLFALPEIFAASAQDYWLGSQLIGGAAFADAGYGSGAVSGSTYFLNVYLTACGTPPSAGVVYPAGTHTVTYNVTLRASDIGGLNQQYGQVDVHQIGTGFGYTVAFSCILNTGGGNSLTLTIQRTLNFTSDGTHAYEFRVVDLIANGADNKRLSVNWISHSFAPTVTSAQSLVLDGTNRLASIRNSTGALVKLATLQGPFIDLAPGYNVLVCDLGDMPDAGLGQPDVRLARPKHVPTRAPTIAVDVLPRDLIL